MRLSAFVCLCPCSALPALAQIAPSENCRQHSRTIAPGTYHGELETECRLQGGARLANFALVLQVKGDLTLTVGADELLVSAESPVTSSFGGEGNLVGYGAASTQEGTGRMRLSDPKSERSLPRGFLMAGVG